MLKTKVPFKTTLSCKEPQKVTTQQRGREAGLLKQMDLDFNHGIHGSAPQSNFAGSKNKDIVQFQR